MLIVTVVALCVPAVTVLAAARIIRSLVREHARERARLIDQVCHLAGRTWTPPPVDDWRPPEPEPLAVMFASPEQMTAEDLEPVV